MSTPSVSHPQYTLLAIQESVWGRVLAFLGWQNKQYSRADLETFMPVWLKGLFLCSLVLSVASGFFLNFSLKAAGLVASGTEADMGNAIVFGACCFGTILLTRVVYHEGKSKAFMFLTSQHLPPDLRRQQQDVLIALIRESSAADNYYRELMQSGLKLRVLDLEYMRDLQQNEQLNTQSLENKNG